MPKWTKWCRMTTIPATITEERKQTFKQKTFIDTKQEMFFSCVKNEFGDYYFCLNFYTALYSVAVLWSVTWRKKEKLWTDLINFSIVKIIVLFASVFVWFKSAIYWHLDQQITSDKWGPGFHIKSSCTVCGITTSGLPAPLKCFKIRAFMIRCFVMDLFIYSERKWKRYRFQIRSFSTVCIEWRKDQRKSSFFVIVSPTVNGP